MKRNPLESLLHSFMEKIYSYAPDNIKSLDNIEFDCIDLLIGFLKAMNKNDKSSMNKILKFFEIASINSDLHPYDDHSTKQIDAIKKIFQSVFSIYTFQYIIDKKYLGDTVNINILQLIYREKMINNIKIANELKLPQQNCKDRLDILDQKGFLYSKYIGQSKTYSLTLMGIQYVLELSKEAI